jgi:CO/xanthine dehydrogenase Mo-binding subunit
MADLVGSNGQRTEFKVVGRANVPGRLSYTIATGGAKYGSDYVVPDMLYANFLRNPHGRVKIKSMDISKAKTLEGVVEIITWEDPEIRDMKGTREPLLTDESDTENEEIGAVVVAVTPEICDEALRLIKVDWEVLPTIVDPRDGLKPDAPVVRVDPKGMKGSYATGDPEAGFREADQIAEFDWAQSLMASHPPNPNGSVAWWAQDPLGVEGPGLYIEGVYPTWGAYQLRPMYNVIFDKLHRGTTFQGGKYCDWMLRRASLITPLLARRTGRPVRCMNIRQNDFYTSNPQRYSHIKIGFKNDGTLTAVEDSTITDSGAPARNARAFAGGFGGGSWEVRFSPFNTTRCLNLKGDSQRVYTSSGKATGSQTSPFDWDGMTSPNRSSRKSSVWM